MAHDPDAKLYCYLDDTHLVVDRAYASLAMAGLQQALAPFGLQLNPAKTVFWSPSGPQGLPLELLAHYSPTLPVLGKHLRGRGDQQEAPQHLGVNASTSLAGATARLSSMWTDLEGLMEGGLPRQAAAALLRTYAGAASQYSLQLEAASDSDVDLCDLRLERMGLHVAEQSGRSTRAILEPI